MDIQKSASIKPTSCTIDEDTIAKIAKFTKKDITPEQLFIFSVKLCDNEIDRDYEAFSEEALQKLAQLMVGKTGIFDHNPRAQNQTARLFDCRVVAEEGRLNSLGQPYLYLLGRAYMIRTDKNSSLITEIEAGIKKETSISCSISRRTCSICAKDNRICGHIRGHRYDNKLCYSLLSEPTDAYEWSFVAIPAQREAGVMKHYKGGTQLDGIINCIKNGTLTSETATDITIRSEDALSISRHIAKLMAEAAAGQHYLEGLRGEVARLACIAQPELSPSTMQAVCRRLDITELESMKKAFAAAVDSKLSPFFQTAPRESQPDKSAMESFSI